jgi:alkylation response protein AidB-like acyl-CoA dehydrogenase
MRFALASEQRAFAHSLRDLLAAADVPTIARAWARGDYDPGRSLWVELSSVGLTGIAIAEADGGSGAHPVDLVVCFEELGRAATPGPYVESVAVLPVLRPGSNLLARIASGDAVATLAAPPLVPFAVDAAAADATYVLISATLHEARRGAELVSVDATRRLCEVTALEGIGKDLRAELALLFGALATAAQILGAGEACLDRAVQYAQQRRQFGKPIGSFQAIKHQLADARVGLDLARPLLYAASVSLAANTATCVRDVSAAKVACSEAAYRASRTALQVHGAIGYTAEYDLSLWLTKIRALVSSWGTPAHHRAQVWDSLAHPPAVAAFE